MRNASLEELMKASARLGDAVVDPAAWPSVMEDICRTVHTTGAILLQSDVRTLDVPRTPGVSDLADAYFRDGWHTRDLRAARGVPLILDGQPVVIDRDIISLDEMRRDAFYNECLTPCGFKWWGRRRFFGWEHPVGVLLSENTKRGSVRGRRQTGTCANLRPAH
jgi:hypothetical protein